MVPVLAAPKKRGAAFGNRPMLPREGATTLLFGRRPRLQRHLKPVGSLDNFMLGLDGVPANTVKIVFSASSAPELR